jgi:hypothetical protein
MTERTNAQRSASARKAASTRQGRDAAKHVNDARKAATSAVTGLGSVARSLGDAAVQSTKSVANRATSIGRR